jgi:hypothetical protein
MSQASRPIALYWLGRAQLASDDPQVRREGALSLLRLPALHGAAHPELAAAGLYESMRLMQELKDSTATTALRKELLANYGQTYYGGKVRAGLGQGKDS